MRKYEKYERREPSEKINYYERKSENKYEKGE